ncbi:MAG: hypothetical protein WC848_01315 [Parcubacteria group bacterium]|jgi:hypothetical protein
MKRKQIEKEVAARTNRRDQIRSSVNAYCAEEFGIKDFFAIADKHLPEQMGGFQVCLVRQVPTPNVEHLATYLSAKAWGLEPVYMSLTRDSFPQQAAENQYKKSLVNSPRMFHGRKGISVQHERLVQDSVLQNIILADLRTKCGRKLPEVHWELMEKAIHNPPQKLELAGFFQELLMSSSKNLPRCVFVRQGRREKIFYGCDLSEANDPRPPADWYYFFYLLLFVSGSRGLASTVDEDPEVIAWFRESNQKIKNICGFLPLILDTPLKVEADGFCSKLNEIPRKALGGNGFLRSLPTPSQTTIDGCFFDLMKHYEKELIAHS